MIAADRADDDYADAMEGDDYMMEDAMADYEYDQTVEGDEDAH